MICPASITPTRSPSWAASAKSWVTSRAGTRTSFRTAASSRDALARVRASRAASGSSSSSTPGGRRRACERARRAGARRRTACVAERRRPPRPKRSSSCARVRHSRRETRAAGSPSPRIEVREARSPGTRSRSACARAAGRCRARCRPGLPIGLDRTARRPQQAGRHPGSSSCRRRMGPPGPGTPRLSPRARRRDRGRRPGSWPQRAARLSAASPAPGRRPQPPASPRGAGHPIPRPGQRTARWADSNSVEAVVDGERDRLRDPLERAGEHALNTPERDPNCERRPGGERPEARSGSSPRRAGPPTPRACGRRRAAAGPPSRTLRPPGGRRTAEATNVSATTTRRWARARCQALRSSRRGCPPGRRQRATRCRPLPGAAPGQLSISVMRTARPQNERVASRYAAGVPTTGMIAIETAVVLRLSQSVERPGSPRLSISSAGLRSTKIATIGSVRKSSAAARCRRQHGEPREGAAPHCCTEPKPASSSAWAQGPFVKPSTNAWASCGFFAP